MTNLVAKPFQRAFGKLKRYSSIFPTAEIDSTFYAQPKQNEPGIHPGTLTAYRLSSFLLTAIKRRPRMGTEMSLSARSRDVSARSWKYAKTDSSNAEKKAATISLEHVRAGRSLNPAKKTIVKSEAIAGRFVLSP